MFRKGVNKVFDKIYDPRRRVVKRCIFVVSGSIKLRAALVAYDVTEQGRAPCTLSPWREEVFISRVRFFLFRLGGFNNIHPLHLQHWLSRTHVHTILHTRNIYSSRNSPRPKSRFSSSPNPQPSTLRSVKAVTDLFLVISRYPVGHTAIGFSFGRAPGSED